MSIFFILIDNFSRIPLCEAVKSNVHLFSAAFMRKVNLLGGPRGVSGARKKAAKLDWAAFVRPHQLPGNFLLCQVYAAKLLLAAMLDDGQTGVLTAFLAGLPGLQQAKILRNILAAEDLLASFRPLDASCPVLVPRLLGAAKAAGVRLDRVAGRFYADLSAAAVNPAPTEEDTTTGTVNRELLLELLINMQLGREQLTRLLDQLIALPLHVLATSGRLFNQGILLCGTLTALAAVEGDEEKVPGPQVITERFSSALEHMIVHVGRVDSLPASALAAFLARFPASADHLSENLFYVCCDQLASRPVRGEPSVYHCTYLRYCMKFLMK